MHRVTDVRVIPPYGLSITFNDGTQRQMDMEHELWGEVFEPLRDPSLFAKVAIDPLFGSLYWPNGADVDTEVLYCGAEGPPPGWYGDAEAESDAAAVEGAVSR